MKPFQRLLIAGFFMLSVSSNAYSHAPGEIPTDRDSSPSGGSPASAVARGENVKTIGLSEFEGIIKGLEAKNAMLAAEVSGLKKEVNEEAALIHKKREVIYKKVIDDMRERFYEAEEDISVYKETLAEIEAALNIPSTASNPARQKDLNNLKAALENLLKEAEAKKVKYDSRAEATALTDYREKSNKELQDAIKAQTKRLEKIAELTHQISANADKIAQMQKVPTYNP